MNRRAMRWASALAMSALALGCNQERSGLSQVVDSAVLGDAQAAPAKQLWTQRATDEPLPEGEVPLASLAPLVKRLKPGVVNIYTTSVTRSPRRQAPQGFVDPFEEFFRRFNEGSPGERRRQSLGSGFIINSDGYVLTNNHVVENAAGIRVKLNDGRELEAKAVGLDPKTDLALLKLQGKDVHDLPIVYLGDSDKLEVGDFTLAVGNPFGLDHSVSLGIVSAKERVIGAGPYDDFIQTDAAINPGNSGGPLFNLRGEVVGVNTAIVAHGQGIGFAVPINMVKELLPQLLEGRVVRGWLGVSIQDVTPELAAMLNLKEARGALVSAGMKGGP
ncbi:MAG: trypsin-like peptidase domain-containing protein, partial [Myxococcales bacterium]